MYELAIFFTVSAISLMFVKPKQISLIKLYSFLIPFVLLTLIVLFYASLYGGYRAGKAFGDSIIPFAISFAVLFFGFKKRSQSNNFKIPIILLTLTALIWSIVFYTFYLKSQIDLNISKIDLNDLLNIQPLIHQVSDKKEVKLINANYKEISFKLPENWNYKPQEIEQDIAYQISCWEKGGANSFVLLWMDTENDLDEYLESIKESLKEQVTHKNCIFEKNLVGEFQNNKTLTCNFSGKLLGLEFKGRLITFNNNGKSFFIVHQGNDDFYNNGIDEKILSSFKIGYLKELNKNETKIPTTWTVFEIEKIGTIALPPTMELRNENSAIALVADVVRDNLAVHKKISIEKSNLLFQPTGCNKREKDALSKYSRMLIAYKKGEPGQFYKWNEQFSVEEKKDLYDNSKHDIESELSLLNTKLIQWFPLDFSPVNGLMCMKTSYIRQMNNNPSVYVECFDFYNDDEIIEITISYRQSENSIWRDDFKKVIQTFNLLNKK